MILSDRDITNRMYPGLGDRAIRILPWPAKERFQPASVELTLSNEAWIISKGEKCTIPAADTWSLEPGQFALGSTVEKVRIPADLVGQLNGKSSWARLGLIVHTTAGFIDPGFEGNITLELANLGSRTIYIPVGVPICQLVFFQMTSPALRPYGSEGLGSHYQGQAGPTPSAL